MKLTKKEQYMEKKIAIVRLHRGVLDPITQVNKLMTFICDIEDLKKGDFVVVELSMKTRAKNFNNDFRVGRVEDFMIFRDGEIAQYRPNNFVVFKINDNDFYMRCNTLLKKKWSLWARYRAIKNKDNKNPRYSIFDDIIKETDSLQFQRLTSWVDVMKPDKDHTDLEKETRIVSIKMQRGVLGKENNKTFNYICDLKDIQIEDYVIVEITRKNMYGRPANDFRIGRVESLHTWNDSEVSKFKPNSFVVCKIADKEFKTRCNEIKKSKKELWELYNIDKKRPNKNPDGIPMNVFDHLIFSNCTLHFDRLSKYQNKMQPAKKQQIKKRKKH